MIILLTTIFGIYSLLSIFTFLNGLFRTAKISPFVKPQKTEVEQLAAAGCSASVWMALTLIFTVPIAYLAWHGITAYGESGWWVILSTVLSGLATLSAMIKNQSVTGVPSGLNVFMLLLAYHGLLVLGGGI